jgi:hypothetical protein
MTISMPMIDRLLSNKPQDLPPRPLKSFSQWKSLFQQESRELSEPFDRAVWGGFIGDRPAYAFAAGYASAVHRMVPGLPVDSTPAFCVTEAGGNHPGAIETTIKTGKGSGKEPAWVLNGAKTFVTGAAEADLFLVAAGCGRDENSGRKKIRIVQINRQATEITIEGFPDMPFIPEISHGRILFHHVSIHQANILPGDGYLDYIKPFRTLEDLYVIGGICGWWFATALRFYWPLPIKEQLVNLLFNCRSLALNHPLAPEVHIALGGLLQSVSHIIHSMEPHWKKTDETTQSLWERDQPLMKVAGQARKLRLAKAWSHYQAHAT